MASIPGQRTDVAAMVQIIDGVSDVAIADLVDPEEAPQPTAAQMAQAVRNTAQLGDPMWQKVLKG